MTYIAACGLASGRFTPSVTFTTPVKKTATIYHENQDIYLEDMHGRRLRRKRRKLFIKDSVNIIQQLSTESFALLTSLQWGPQVQYMDGGIMGTTYKYNIVQTNFLASDLLDFGITNGNAIKGMKLKIASGRSPSQNYENFRVAYKYISPSEEWTREETNIDPSTGATLTAEAFFHAMRQVYFRDNIDKFS